MIREYHFDGVSMAIRSMSLNMPEGKKEPLSISLKESLEIDTLEVTIYNKNGVALYTFCIPKNIWEDMHKLTCTYSAYGDKFGWTKPKQD